MSTTSAQRFARRVRARRWRRIVWAAVVLALVAGLGWVVWGSPWLRVRSIEVHGTDRIPASEIQQLAAPSVGEPLVLVQDEELRRRVAALRLVRDASVERAWPGTLRITVQERRPVATVPLDGRFALVDEDGVVVETVARPPRGLARVDVDLRTAGPPAMNAALAVWGALPAGLRGDVRSIGADTPDGVWLRLDDGALVRWGSASEPEAKAAALAAVRKAESGADVYDVTSPGTPAVDD